MLRGTSRSTEYMSTPGRSNCTTICSPSRQASIGIAAGRAVVPQTCCASRSKSRNGSVATSMVLTSSGGGSTAGKGCAGAILPCRRPGLAQRVVSPPPSQPEADPSVGALRPYRERVLVVSATVEWSHRG